MILLPRAQAGNSSLPTPAPVKPSQDNNDPTSCHLIYVTGMVLGSLAVATLFVMALHWYDQTPGLCRWWYDLDFNKPRHDEPSVDDNDEDHDAVWSTEMEDFVRLSTIHEGDEA